MSLAEMKIRILLLTSCIQLTLVILIKRHVRIRNEQSAADAILWPLKNFLCVCVRRSCPLSKYTVPTMEPALGSWASAHRGKWGQLTPWKMDEKLKSENMQKRAVFCVYIIF